MVVITPETAGISLIAGCVVLCLSSGVQGFVGMFIKTPACVALFFATGIMSLVVGIVVGAAAYGAYTSGGPRLPQGTTLLVSRSLLLFSSVLLFLTVTLFHVNLALGWVQIMFKEVDEPAVWAVSISGLVGSFSGIVSLIMTFATSHKVNASTSSSRASMTSNWVFQPSPILVTSMPDIHNVTPTHRRSRRQILCRSFESPPPTESVSRCSDSQDMFSTWDSPLPGLDTSKMNSDRPTNESLVDGGSFASRMSSFKPTKRSDEIPRQGNPRDTTWSFSALSNDLSVGRSEAPYPSQPNFLEIGSKKELELLTPIIPGETEAFTSSPMDPDYMSRTYTKQPKLAAQVNASGKSKPDSVSLITFSSSSNSSGEFSSLKADKHSLVWPDLSLLLPWQLNASASSSFERLNIVTAVKNGRSQTRRALSESNKSNSTSAIMKFQNALAIPHITTTTEKAPKFKPTPPPRSTSYTPTPPDQNAMQFSPNPFLPVVRITATKEVSGSDRLQHSPPSYSQPSDLSFTTPLSDNRKRTEDNPFNSAWTTSF